MTRIIEVLPPVLRWTLAALTAFGLMLGAVAETLALRARRLRREGLRLAADVGLLESTLVPSVPARVGLASLSAAHRAADDLAAGGDFYDAFELPGGRTALVLGDVEGHGRPALALTAMARYTLRAYLEAGLTPRAALKLADEVLSPHLDERLVTATTAVYDAHAGRLSYACAGHPSPLLIGVQVDSPLIYSSPPIGSGPATGRRQITVPLPPGTAALFYTDGVIDPRIDRSGGTLDRLASHLRASSGDVDAQELLRRLLPPAAVPDDTSACLLRPLATGGRQAGEHIEEVEFDAHGMERWGEAFLLACHVPLPAAKESIERAAAIAQAAGAAVVTVTRARHRPAMVTVTEPVTMRLASAPVAAAQADGQPGA